MNKVFTFITRAYNYVSRRVLFILPASVHLKILFKKKISRKLDLNNPKSFNEKIQWLKLNDRNPRYTELVDKYDAKEYIKKIIGEEYVIPTLGVYDKFDDIDFSKLPNSFVIKCTHDSGGIFICKDKSSFDKKNAEKMINRRLRRNFYYFGREWPYKNIVPRIIVEKCMTDSENEDLVDYKVMCFNGEPKIIFTCTDRFSDGLKVTFFDLDWNKLPFERHYPASKKKISKPKNYEKMLKLSKLLSKNMPFVRMDWYEIKGKLYFGEFTFYPGSGLEEFTPEEWDYKLGDMLDLKK